MDERSTARAGGPAAAGGFEYQKFVTAWAAAHILAESPITSLFELPSERITVLRTETEQPVDDLMLVTESGGIIVIQIKRSLSLSLTDKAPLASVIDQCVRQIVLSRPSQTSSEPRPWERPFDASRDRIVVIARSLPSSLATVANALLTKLRVEPQVDLDEVIATDEQREVSAVLTEQIRRSWAQATGRSATAADVLACLRPLRFLEVHVETGGRDTLAAKTLLQRVVRDTRDIDVSWATLANLSERLIATRGGADRATLQQSLTESKINLNAPPSYERDIERLKEYSARIRGDLASLAVLHVAGSAIRIDRPIASVLSAAALDGSWLITGGAGSGKSGALFGFAEEAVKLGTDVVVLGVDHISARSMRHLRDELDLEHDVVDILANWPGDARAYFIIDALDAARSPATLELTRHLLQTLLDSRSRWQVVASVREFDLINSPQLQRLFVGKAHEVYFDPALPNVRHIRVPDLTDSELQQVTLLAPTLGELVSESGPEVMALLRVPFHLRLLAELLDEGVAIGELAAIRTRADLLERYWAWRVLGDADPDGEGREELLRVAVRYMIAERSLRVLRETLATSPVFNSPALNKLLSNSVLALWRSPYRTAPERDVLTFGHHILFDYAASRLVLRHDPVTTLRADPEMILSFRPSLVMHGEYLWIADPSRHEFWRFAADLCADTSLPAVSKTVASTVAVTLAADIADFGALLHLLNHHPGASEAVRHVFGALLAGQPDVPIVGHPRALWANLMARVSAALEDVLAYALRPSLMTATDEIDHTTELERNALSQAAVNLATYSRHRSPFDQSLMTDAIRTVCRTYSANPNASREIIVEACRPENVDRSGLDEIYWISRELHHLVTVDSEVVAAIYTTAFSFELLEDREVSLGGGALLHFTSTSRQQQQTTLHSLMDQFATFLQAAPRVAIPVLAFIVEDYVQRKETLDYESIRPQHFQLLGTEATIKQDGSSIWDADSVAGPDIIQLLDEFEEYIGGLSADPNTEELLRVYTQHVAAAVSWTRLLRAATSAPLGLGHTVRELAWAMPLLLNMDTTVAVANFIRALTPHLPRSDRERIERTILAIPEHRDAERQEILTRIRNRILGVIDRSLLVTDEARAVSAQLAASGGPPPNEPLFEFSGGFVDYGDEDYLRDLRVPTEEPKTKVLLQLLQPIKQFAAQHTNDVPSREEVDQIAPAMSQLYRYVTDHSDTVHAEALLFAWGHLADAAAKIVRLSDFEDLPLRPLVMTLLAESAESPQPAPQPDDEFKTPSWGAPAARISAAEGIIRASHFISIVDDEWKRTLSQLARDPNPAVRFQVASGLSNLYYSAPDTMWSLAEQFATNERAIGVLQGFVGGTLMRIAAHAPDRVVPLVLDKLLVDGSRDDDARTVRNYCFDIVVGLYLWQGNVACEGYLRSLLGNISANLDDTSRVASECARAIKPETEAPRDVQALAQQRALAMLTDILEAAAVVRDATSESEVVRELASLVTHIGLLVYRIALIRYSERDTSPARERFALIEPLLLRLASFGYPMLAHHLLQTLQSFVTTAPEAVFRLVGTVVETASQYGYHYESEAERIIVQLLQRYMAEYPTVLRTPEGRTVFLNILDRFVQAGWPAARRLTYRLEDAFR